MYDGLFLLNKPAGVSSRGYGIELKRKLKLKKVGHAGTLDLEATGLLLVLSGRALKLQNYLIDGSKVYSGSILLGVTSATDDVHSNCELTEFSEEKLSQINKSEVLETIRQTFAPVYNQKPSLVSSKKVGGISSRILMQQGITPELKENRVELEFEELDFIAANELFYKVKVSKGFYVRALARDIGTLIGVGGVAKSINRDAVYPYRLTEAVDLNRFENQASISLDDLGNSYKTLNQLSSLMPYSRIALLNDDESSAFRSGNKAILTRIKERVGVSDSLKSFYSVMDCDENFLGIVAIENDIPSFKFVF